MHRTGAIAAVLLLCSNQADSAIYHARYLEKLVQHHYVKCSVTWICVDIS